MRLAPTRPALITGVSCVAVGLLVALTACSDGGTAGTGTLVPFDSGLVSTSTIVISPSTTSTTTSAPATTAVPFTTSTPTTLLAPVSTTAVQSGAPGIPTTGPFASTPPPESTLSPDLPGPPMMGCVDAPSSPATVELAIDNDTVTYAGAVVPCVRLLGTQRLAVRNVSQFPASVTIGDSVRDLAAGAVVSTTMRPTYGFGDTFDVVVDPLGVVVVVQVLS